MQAPEEFQAPNFNAPPWMATKSLGPWLELEIWSFSGAWHGASVRRITIENIEERHGEGERFF